MGWVAPGRYHDKLMHMKYAISSFNVPSTQMAAATLCWKCHYHRAISGGCGGLISAIWRFIPCWIREYFPCEICITRPKGGFLLWIELPEQVDMVCVARQLYRMKIRWRQARFSRLPANTVIVCASTALCRSAGNLSRALKKANWRCRVSGNGINSN